MLDKQKAVRFTKRDLQDIELIRQHQTLDDDSAAIRWAIRQAAKAIREQVDGKREKGRER